MAAEYDNAWKELLERFFEHVLAFFFPLLFGEIDWSQGYESLDTELRKILPEAVVGRRVADALVKAVTPPREEVEGERDSRYVHVEVQCQPQEDFANRVDNYNAVIKLRLGQPVVTLLILGDGDPRWRPSQYLFRSGGFCKQLDFPTAKLVDYRGREAELEQDGNPVALFVLAHLLTLDTREENPARAEGKLRLLQRVIERKMEEEQARQLVRLIDWLVVLPAESQRQVWQRLLEQGGEKAMPFRVYPEQVGYDRGRQEGLLQAIEFGLGIKFGEAGLALMPLVRALDGPTLLQKVMDAIKGATSVEDVRHVLPRDPTP